MDSSHDIEQENWMQYDDQEYNAIERLETGRQSTCMNEDNYDYAIELNRDDEYRQAADALPNIAELDDVNDDDLLIFLDEKRQSIGGTLVAASPKRHGLVQQMRESLLLLQPRRKGGHIGTENDCESNTCRLDRRESDCSVIGMIETSKDNISVDARQKNHGASSPRSMSSSSDLPDTSCKLEAGLLDGPSSSSPSPSPKKSDKWNLSSFCEARILSVKRATAGVRSWTVQDPSNPVTTLFEPHSVLSRKGLLMMSTKSKAEEMDAKQYESSQFSDGRSHNSDYLIKYHQLESV